VTALAVSWERSTLRNDSSTPKYILAQWSILITLVKIMGFYTCVIIEIEYCIIPYRYMQLMLFLTSCYEQIQNNILTNLNKKVGSSRGRGVCLVNTNP